MNRVDGSQVVERNQRPVQEEVDGNLSLFARFLRLFQTATEETQERAPLESRTSDEVHRHLPPLPIPLASILVSRASNPTPTPPSSPAERVESSPLSQRVSARASLPSDPELERLAPNPTPTPPTSPSQERESSPLSQRVSARASLPSDPELERLAPNPTPTPPTSLSQGRESSPLSRRVSARASLPLDSELERLASSPIPTPPTPPSQGSRGQEPLRQRTLNSSLVDPFQPFNDGDSSSESSESPPDIDMFEKLDAEAPPLSSPPPALSNLSSSDIPPFSSPVDAADQIGKKKAVFRGGASEEVRQKKRSPRVVRFLPNIQ